MSTKLSPPADDFDDDDRTLPEYLTDILLTPLRLLTSPTFYRLYLRLTLLLLTLLSTLALSITAYLIFYNTFIPALAFTLPLHLQYSPTFAHHPYALTKITRGAVGSDQPYDVTVRLCLPLTDDNVGAGNFMVAGEVRGPEETVRSVKGPDPSPGKESQGPPEQDTETITEVVAPVLASSARPALLFPEHTHITTIRRLLQLPLLVFGFTREQTCLDVPVFQGAAFERGWRRRPDALKIEVAAQGGPVKALRVSEGSVTFTARMEGLRWWVWRFRTLGAVVGVAGFWVVSMGVAVAVWAGLGWVWELVRGGGNGKEVEGEAVKNEVEEGSSEGLIEGVKRETDADDEDEDAELVENMGGSLGRDDSGLGTSLESSGGGRSVRRRKSER